MRIKRLILFSIVLNYHYEHNDVFLTLILLTKGKIDMRNMAYTINEAREASGIGRTKLYEAINKGLLPAKKFGKRTLILRDDLEAFLSQLSPYSPN